MKTPIYFKNLILFFALFALNQTIASQEIVSKTIQKNVLITLDGTFYIDNKYGNISINGWDNNTAEITTVVKVFNKKESEALALLERIQPEIKIIGDFIYVESKIIEKKGNVFSRYFDKANPLKLDKNNIQIDYEINLPKSIALEITNKFGDVIIESFEGKLKTALQHGDMWINNDIQDATINIKFGKLKAKNITKAHVELKNAELDLNSSNEIKLISSGSNIDINTIAKLDLSSNKDVVNIAEVEAIKIDSKFSEINIQLLLLSAHATTKVTTLSISEIKNPNPIIIMDQESSEININITNTHFNFKARLTEGILKIPKTFENINNKMINKSKKIREIHATYGANSEGNITVNGYKGSIILKDSSLNSTN